MPTSSSNSTARARAGIRPRRLWAEDLGDLISDLVHGVERRQRILEDHRESVAALAAPRLLVHRGEVHTPILDATAEADACSCRQQPHHRERSNGLAGTRLAHDRERRSPAWTDQLTPSTAFTTPSSVAKSTRRSVTARRGCSPSVLTSIPEASDRERRRPSATNTKPSVSKRERQRWVEPEEVLEAEELLPVRHHLAPVRPRASARRRGR